MKFVISYSISSIYTDCPTPRDLAQMHVSSWWRPLVGMTPFIASSTAFLSDVSFSTSVLTLCQDGRCFHLPGVMGLPFLLLLWVSSDIHTLALLFGL